jgi:hypothetical protein
MMTRLLLCLALCLGFALLYGTFRRPVEDPPAAPARAEALRPAWLASLATDSGAGFPAALPWAGLLQLGPGAGGESDPLPDPDPVAFLEKCLRRYDREVKGYSLVMQKQERVAGTVQPRETVEVRFREKPFSVCMKWLAGARQAKAALYVEGENDNNLLVLPAGLISFVGVVRRPLDSPDVKASGRYGIEGFGLKKATERVLAGWRLRRAQGTLHVTYEGVYRVAETGGRLCYKLHRSRYAEPDDDGITDLVLYLDVETWLQTGSVLRGEGGRLIGEYYFRDIRLNPVFPPDQFTAAALKR